MPALLYVASWTTMRPSILLFSPDGSGSYARYMFDLHVSPPEGGTSSACLRFGTSIDGIRMLRKRSTAIIAGRTKPVKRRGLPFSFGRRNAGSRLRHCGLAVVPAPGPRLRARRLSVEADPLHRAVSS